MAADLDRPITGVNHRQRHTVTPDVDLFDRIVARHGWSYRGSPGWRSRVIYDTNLRMAHAAGRWERIQRVKDRRPYLRHVAVLDSHTRPHHREWHGTVLPVDHAFWRTHFPPNGWHCRCIIQQLSRRDLNRYGYEVTANPPSVPVISPPVDAGPLPLPRSAPASRLVPKGLREEEYVDRFLAEFGAARGKPVVFTDALGEPVVIDEAMFRKTGGGYRVTRLGREETILLMADTLRSPDEVWWVWTERPKGVFQLARRYIGVWDAGGQVQNMFSVFELSKSGWSGVTGFRTDRTCHLENQRQGTLAWRRL